MILHNSSHNRISDNTLNPNHSNNITNSNNNINHSHNRSQSNNNNNIRYQPQQNNANENNNNLINGHGDNNNRICFITTTNYYSNIDFKLGQEPPKKRLCRRPNFKYLSLNIVYNDNDNDNDKKEDNLIIINIRFFISEFIQILPLL